MKPFLTARLIILAFVLYSCTKSEQDFPRGYEIKPTIKITTNYIQIVDNLGWPKIDTGRAELVFFNFYTTGSVSDTLDSLAQKQQSALNDYYRTNTGNWRMRYLGGINLVNADSLKLRKSGGGDFQEQLLTLAIDSSFYHKPLFELWHEPTNTVYARYFPDPAGTKLVLRFSGPRYAQFDTLSTKAIAEQFNFKLSPAILGKQHYNHNR